MNSFTSETACAEAAQWQLRRRRGKHLLPQIRKIAEGDTAALFVLAARLGGATAAELRAVRELGVAYHWLDDLQAHSRKGVFGLRQVDPDLRDGICTLMSAFNDDAPAAQRFLRREIKTRRSGAPAWLAPFWSVLGAMDVD